MLPPKENNFPSCSIWNLDLYTGNIFIVYIKKKYTGVWKLKNWSCTCSICGCCSYFLIKSHSLRITLEDAWIYCFFVVSSVFCWFSVKKSSSVTGWAHSAAMARAHSVSFYTTELHLRFRNLDTMKRATIVYIHINVQLKIRPSGAKESPNPRLKAAPAPLFWHLSTRHSDWKPRRFEWKTIIMFFTIYSYPHIMTLSFFSFRFTFYSFSTTGSLWNGSDEFIVANQLVAF